MSGELVVFSTYKSWSCAPISEPLKWGPTESSRCLILAAFLLRYEWQDNICVKKFGQYYFGFEPNCPVALCLISWMELASWGLQSNEPTSFLTSPCTEKMAWRSLDIGYLEVCPVAPRAYRKTGKTAQMLKMAGAANQRTVNFLKPEFIHCAHP